MCLTVLVNLPELESGNGIPRNVYENVLTAPSDCMSSKNEENSLVAEIVNKVIASQLTLLSFVDERCSMTKKDC